MSNYRGDRCNLALAGAIILTLCLPSSLPAALVGYFPFEGNADESFLGNDGIEVNGPTFVTGQFGQAMQLDALNSQHVIIPDSGVEVGAADYSVTFWINTTTEDDVSYLKMGTDGPPGLGRRSIDACSPCGLAAGQVAFQMDTADAGPFFETENMHDGNWHHWAFVRDSDFGELILFRDGTEVVFGSDDPGDATSPGEIGVIGAGLNGDQTIDGSFFTGLIDELAFYDHPLTPNEVTTNMNSGVFLPSTPAPAVSTQSATDIVFESATLNGNLTAGIGANVSVYWGETDGGTTPGNWDDVIDAGHLGQGTFAESLTGLQSGTPYFYRAFADNPGGSTFALSSQSFTTNAFPASSTWTTNGTGLWSDDANWTGIFPNSNQQTA
ncbi:LamG domain-containing protein, partial [Pirellulales bacterium]|nr:LamG domain-containing protein [Pirellulales bacterium]